MPRSLKTEAATCVDCEPLWGHVCGIANGDVGGILISLLVQHIASLLSCSHVSHANRKDDKPSPYIMLQTTTRETQKSLFLSGVMAVLPSVENIPRPMAPRK